MLQQGDFLFAVRGVEGIFLLVLLGEGKGYGYRVGLIVVRLQGKLRVCRSLREYRSLADSSHGGVGLEILCPVG